MIALAETRTVLRSILEESQLDESISQRQFWDFYAVFANGLEDVPGIDVDYIVDQAWMGVIEPYTVKVFHRLIQSSIVAMSKVDPGVADRYDHDGQYSVEKLLPFIRKDLKKMFAAKTVPEMIATFEWFGSSDEVKHGDWEMSDWFTSRDGTWAGLANKLIVEYRKRNASRQAKALSVDRMLAWSHHNDTMASNIGKWLPVALDARSHGNMNTLLSSASPSVRDALKSASHGIGKPELTMSDHIEIELNRTHGVTRVKRTGDHFTVDCVGTDGFRPKEEWEDGKGPWKWIPVQKEFEVSEYGLYDLVSGKAHMFRQKRPDGSGKSYNHSFGFLYRGLDRRELKSSDQ